MTTPMRTLSLTSWAAALVLLACSPAPAEPGAPARAEAPSETVVQAQLASGALRSAVFAGGCFWCMEGPFEKFPGVVSVVSGYAGGAEPNPTYDQVGHGRTGHAEVVQVVYDPKKVTYEALLETYWHNVDPTQADGQFCDRGRQYRTVVFYANDAEKAAVLASKARLESTAKLPGPIVTEVVPAAQFYPAEGYHQDFYRTNPERYQSYREGCGRDRRLKALWGDAAKH